jgi:hypothetical protein
MPHFESPRRRAAPAVAGALLLLLAANVIAGCASGAHTGSQGSAKPVTFSSPQYGFSIAHPAGWTQVTNPQAVLGSSKHVSFTVGWKEATPRGATGGMAVAVLGYGVRLSVPEQRLYFRYLLEGYGLNRSVRLASPAAT